MSERSYIAIDLKSFYASVECVERGLNPLTTNLVVADSERTLKTICLAVTPSLKKLGIGGRARLFEVVQKVDEANAIRKLDAMHGNLEGSSYDSQKLDMDRKLKIDYITAPPRMALYIDYSTRIYSIYLKYVDKEDIHVYSIDEVFMDVTAYLKTYNMTAAQLTRKIIREIYDTTGITATAGIGTNMYLCKVAMDIVAKRIPADEYGVRIAELDEFSYRQLLWNHTPLTDFWRLGRGYAAKLQANGLFTMGDIARCSLGTDNDFYNQELLYRLFGVNAELLIDHAWGYEPVTMADIKSYRPADNSMGSGQVLHCAYPADKARLIVKEMTDLLVLELVEKELCTDQLVLNVGYDIDNLTDKVISGKYSGEIVIDHYGRKVPKAAHGTVNLPEKTASTKAIMEAVMGLYDRIVDKELLVRRINITANKLVKKGTESVAQFRQLSLFEDYNGISEADKSESDKTEAGMTADAIEGKALHLQNDKEEKMQQAVLDIKKRFGKNALLKGMNLEDGAMTITRNSQIGGHKA